MQECQQQLAALAAYRDAGPTGAPPPQEDLRALMDQLQPAQRDIGATAEQALARAEEALGKVEELAAAQRARDEGTADSAARHEAERDALRVAVQACEQQVAALTARTETIPVNDPSSLDELRRMIEQTQLMQRETAATAHASGAQALARAEDALRRIEELAAAEQARDQHTSELLAHAAADRAALSASVQECAQRLPTLAARLDATPVIDPSQLDEFREALEEIQHAQRQTAAEARAIAEQTTARAEEARREVEALVAQHAGDEHNTRTAALQAAVECLAADLKEAKDRFQRMRPASGSSTEAISQLARRVDAVETAIAALLQPAEKRAAAKLGRPPVPSLKRWVPPTLVAAGLLVACLVAVVAVRWQGASIGRGATSRLTHLPSPPASASRGSPSSGAFRSGVEALSRGDLPAAAQIFDDLVKAEGGSAEARNNLAVALAEQGQIDAAAEQLRRALELRPDYERARLNLARLQALHAAQPRPTAPAPPTAAVETKAVDQQEAAKAGANLPAAKPPAAPLPSVIVSLEPVGAMAYVVEPDANQACAYRRADEGIVMDKCYAFVTARVRAWPGWLVADAVTAQSIRLVDDTGETRLQIVPEGHSVSGDTVQIPQAAFTVLATKTVPGRTSWVVSNGQPAGTSTGPEAKALREALERWRQAWQEKRFDAYVASYSPTFVPQKEHDLGEWRARKRRLFKRSGTISVQIAAPSIFLIEQGATALITFEQSYRSASVASRALKVLRWQRQGEPWTITAETVFREEPLGPPRR